MRKTVDNIIQLGIHTGLNPLQRARVLMINWFVLIGVSVSLFLLIVNTIVGLTIPAIITSVSAVLTSFVFYLNKRRKYEFAAIYLLSFFLTVIVLGSYVAYVGGRFTETENLLFCIMTLSIFLFDGLKSHLLYFLTLLSLWGLKFLKLSFQDLPIDIKFVLMLIIVSVISVALYLFAYLFKGVLVRSIKQLNEQKDLLYNLIDNIPIYIGIYDHEGKYSLVNIKYESAFLMRRDEIIGRKMREVIPDENVPTYEPMLEKALSGERVTFHHETPMKNGTVISAKGEYIPIFDKNGEVRYVTVTLYDVTDLEKVKKQLENANDAKNRLFNIVAHDIKNPLNNFEMILKSSQDGRITEKDFDKFLEKVREKFLPLKGTISELLEWSRAQLNGITTNPSSVSVDKLAKEALELLDAEIQEKKIKTEVKGTIPKIEVDEGHMKIILRNLLHNAIKFTPNEGTVRVGLEKQNGSIAINIEDTGIGMSEKLIDQIKTNRIVDSQQGTSGESGTGIGLSFCVELIEKNHGELSIRSEEGKGSVFTITF